MNRLAHGETSMSVGTRFSKFLENIKITEFQHDEGAAKRESAVRVLNRHYWGNPSGTANSKYIGSWAKQTRIRPPRDVDVLFELPSSVHSRFEGRVGNKQSQLLQEVRGILAATFTRTTIKGDGPVVLVPFTSYNVELVPSFQRVGGGHLVCMTTLNGWYKHEDYAAQSSSILSSNLATSGNTRDLVRMMKCWQRYCSVSLKSFYIEILASSFLDTWGNSGKSTIYYDWMVRDFLSFVLKKQNTYIYAPGTLEQMYLGSIWASRAETALSRAKKACTHEANKEWSLAGEEWQKIFGTDIPKYV